MKKSLLLLITLFLTGGVFLSVSAQEKVYADFSGCEATQGNLTWNGDNPEYQYFTWNVSWSNQLHGIKFGEMKAPYGNITEFAKLVVDCTIEEGTGYRIMFYATTKGTEAGGTTVVNESGKHEYVLTNFNMDPDYLTTCTDICLSGLGGSGKVQVNEMYLVKSEDPLAGPKKILNEKIALGKMQSSYAKTTESFAALTTKLTQAETALNDASATPESLTAATEALDAAIKGLTLKEGYRNLTQAMFLEYTSLDNPEVKGTAGCAYEVNKASGMPYGDGSVNMLKWADLTRFDKLIVVTASGGPRFCMNRIEKDGQQAATQEDSKMIDINANNGTTWSTEKYMTVDGNVYTVDLNAIEEEYSYARLHCVKNHWGPDLVVTDMLLYKEAYAIDADIDDDLDVEFTVDDEDVEDEVLFGETVTMTIDLDEDLICEVSVKDEAGEDVEVKNSKAGVYTFTMPANDVVVSASLVKAEVDTYVNVDYQYGTFVASFDYEIPEDATAYYVEEAKGTTLVLTKLTTDFIPANQPVIVEATEMSVILEGEGSCKKATNVTKEGYLKHGLLYGVLKDTKAPIGSYVLQNLDDETNFYHVEEEIVVPANHAFLQLPTSSAKVIAISGDDEDATAIKGFAALTGGYDAIYNAAGQKVNALQKGANVVVKGGKSYKIFVK